MISQKQLVQTSCGQVGAAGERSGSDGGRASSGKGASTSGSVGSDSRPRLAKVLAACGVASRRACEGLIADGRVRVNGNLVKEQGTTVDPARDKVEVFRSPDAAVAGTFVSPLEVEVLGDPRRLRIVVAEGKKHEVRELVKAAGMNLLSLRRVRIGGFRLPRDLGLGGFKALTPADLKLITDARAQELASVSGATRAAAQQAAQTAATRRASVPRALRDMPEEVLEKFRKARGDKS
eukprot:XP_001701217.1 predicted protein [Chlamydomonas reinhardtii]